MNISKYIDHTLLKPDASQADILTLCLEAIDYKFASVCVNPYWVEFCAETLKGFDAKVCTVIGFPLGANTNVTKMFETERAISEGATEVDMVINIGALKFAKNDADVRDDFDVRDDILGVVKCAHSSNAIVKVIIETSLLTDEEKVRACELAKDAGADFVKTSTGFAKGGATVADVELMRSVVGNEMGVKASGGIRDFITAQQMIAAGATRIGTSAGVTIVKQSSGSNAETSTDSY